MNPPVLSNSQIDALGERLKTGSLAENDELLFVHFYGPRLGFAQRMLSLIQSMPKGKFTRSGLEITTRSVKSTASIGDKLRRLDTRLSQIQDIVGARIILASNRAREEIIAIANATLPVWKIDDYRDASKDGYRAVHAILRDGPNRFELQLRTTAENLWATLVENLIPTVGIEVKYGGGPEDLQSALLAVSDSLATLDRRIDLEITEEAITGLFAESNRSDVMYLIDELSGPLSIIRKHMGQ